MPETERNKISADPESTWGASEDAKAAWEDKYGDKARKEAAKRERERDEEATK